MQQFGSVFCEKVKEGILEDILSKNKDNLPLKKRVHYFTVHTTGGTEIPMVEVDNMVYSADKTPSDYDFVNEDLLQFTKQGLMQRQPKTVFLGAEDRTKRSKIPSWRQVVSASLLKKSLELVNCEEEEEIKFVLFVENENENLERLNTKTTRELGKYSHYLPDTISAENAEEIIKKTNHKLSELSFTKLSVELTPSKIMKYRFSLSENILLTVFKPFEDVEGLGANGVMYDLCVDETSIRSGFADLDSLIKASKKFVNHYHHE